MNPCAWFITIALSLQTQAAGSRPMQAADCLMLSEKNRLEKEGKLDGRIRIYDQVSARCESSLLRFVLKQEFQYVPAHLECWTRLLDASLKEIEADTGRKHRSKALIRYEIRLRKAIVTVQESKIKATVERLDDFEAWLARAEEIRKRLVEILFPK